MFCCFDCGRVFKSMVNAEHAMTCGCPTCGGTDIEEIILHKTNILSRQTSGDDSGGASDSIGD